MMTGSGDTVSQQKRPVQEPVKSDVRMTVLGISLVDIGILRTCGYWNLTDLCILESYLLMDIGILPTCGYWNVSNLCDMAACS